MVFQSPGAVLLELGPLTIRWYGLLTALAFMTCLSLMHKLAEKHYPDLDQDDISNFAIACIVGGLVGARSWFVILNADYFLANPMESFQIWLGGQSIQGGILGAAIASLAYEFFSKKKNPVDSYVTKFALACVVTPVGQAIGRWGNFFNEEAFGKVTDLPWGLYISHTGQYHHPTFLYEGIWNLMVFAILLMLLKRSFSAQQLIGSYLALYSLGRLFFEQLRTDSLYIGSFKAAALISLVTIVIAGIIFCYNSPQEGK